MERVMEPDPAERARLIRKYVILHRRAAEKGELEKAEQAARNAIEHAQVLVAWLEQGGELGSEWDRWA